MNNNKLIKFLIPLVAIVVVFESIVLVNNLEKPTEVNQSNKVEEKNPTEEVVIENPVINFDFKVSSKTPTEMKLGKTYKIDLVLNSVENKAIDGLETYIKYDPEIFKITNLVSNSKLVKSIGVFLCEAKRLNLSISDGKKPSVVLEKLK
jgi:hypothetical protein